MSHGIALAAFLVLFLSHAVALFAGWWLGIKVDPHIMLSNPKKAKDKPQKDMQDDASIFDDEVIDGTEPWIR